MSKNIQVKLTFSSDTRAAQQQLNQLQQTLNNIAATPITGSGLKTTAADIQAATSKALELKVALQNATNVNTGKLNFNKFNQELKKNKTTLKEYAMQLQKLGPEGVQAFSQLAQSIRTAETPLVSMQGKLAALGQTFMNTVKWSISSSMIQGVTRAFASTIDYAKDLNESLNNIRIVTGKSIDDVSKFAVQANKAAKALSATTDEYAKASLIYFQQGLGDSEVEERTNTTLKLAKVVGESAETTSEWMTAIWNNFDDGSRSLENYADVLAKLGAATASSADEIAGGLEKFAAVSETVGLSYEYAASALATITAETRQSEDVVGTALKTIFARVENLSLGETLDDGTTLGKYSEALAKAGVSIKDSNGNLKQMDDILDSIGMQWQVLGKDQQVALAQSVAGIRQYNQFMALMDNWDVMEKNVELAREANGELENQHEIWETGIEGATSRVKEELNEIKNSLLGENDLLPLLNIAEGFLDFVGDLVDSLGGLPGLLSIIASVGLKMWGPQAAAGLTNMVNGIKSLYGVASGKSQADKNAAVVESASINAKMFTDSGMGNEEASTMSQFSKDNAARVIETEQAQGELNSAYKETLHLLEQIIQKRQEEAQLAAKGADEASESLGKEKEALIKEYGKEKEVWDKKSQTRVKKRMVGNVSATEITEDLDKAGKYESNIDNLGRSNQRTGSIVKEAGTILQTSKRSLGKGADKAQVAAVKTQTESYKKLKSAVADYDKINTKANKGTKEGRALIAKARKEVKNATNEFKKNSKAVNVADNTTKKYSKTTGISEKKLQGVTNASKNEADAIKKSDNAKKNAEKTQDNYNKKLKEGEQAGQGFATSFISAMQGVASTAAGVQMLVGAFDTLTTSLAEGEFGFSEFLSVLTSVGFAIPMLIPLFQLLGKAIHFDTIKTKIAASMKDHLAKAEEKRADKAMANAVKVKAANEVEQSSDKATIITKLGKWFASGPWGWAIALAAIAAIAGLGLAISASVSNKKQAASEEEQQTENIETAKNSLEAAEGWNEESNSMDDLIAKHKELKEVNDQTVEGQKALLDAQKAIIDQVPTLIEKYKEIDEAQQNLDLGSQISSLEAAAAIGDISQIEKITDEIDRAITTSMVGENGTITKGKSAAASRVLKKMADQTGDTVDAENTFKWHVGDSNNKLGALRLADKLGVDAKSGGWFGSGASVEFTMDASDPKAFVEQYEKLQEFVDEMEQAGLTTDDTYREVKEGINAAKESYEELKALADEGITYELQNAAYNLSTQLSDVSSYEEYERVSQEFIESVTQQKIATEEQAKAWLRAQSTLSVFTLTEQKAQNATEKYGEAVGNKIKEYVKSLNSEEDLTAFLKIDFDKVQAKSAWDNLTEYYKSLEKSETYKKDATGVAAGIKNLKANGTREDYEKLQSDISWGQNGIIEYSEFLGKTFEEQEEYLQSLQIQINNFETEELKKGLQELYMAYNDAIEEGDKIAAQNISDMIEQHKISLALAEKEVEASQKALEKKERERKANLKELNDEVDRYHEVEQISNKLTKTMDKLAKAKEQAYGSKRLAIIDQEIKGIETEIAVQDKLITQSKNYLELDKKNLQNLNIGVQFDDMGNITNYSEIQQRYLQKLANTTKGSDEYSKIEEEYELFKDYAAKYEETWEQYDTAVTDKADKEIEKLNKKLEGIEYTIEVNIDINDTKLKRLEYLLESYDDPLANSVSDIQKQAILWSENAETYLSNIQTYEDGIKKVLETAGASEADIAKYLSGDSSAIAGLDLTPDQINALDEYTDGILNDQKALESLQKTIRGSVMETFNAFHDKIAQTGERFNSFTTIISNYQNMIDVIGKKTLGIDDKFLEDMEEVTISASQGAVENAKAQMDTTAKALEDAKQKMAESEVGSDTYKYWANVVDELDQQLLEDQENFTSTWSDSLQTAADIFEAQMNRAFDNLDDQLAGSFGSLEDLSASFTQSQTVADRYLDNSEKLYELSKLNRQIQKDIDGSSNVRAQKELAELQKLINDYQANGVDMSERDLKALQQRYNLKLAEIALEEAQNAKSTVRLRRDSEGNFGYVYTADETKVEDAQQNYEDQLEASRKMGEEQSKELTEAIISNRQAMVNALREIRREDFEDTEAYEIKLQEVTEFYTEQEAYLINELNKVITRSEQTYKEDYLAYEGWNVEKINSAANLSAALGDATKGIYGKMGENASGWQTSFNTIIEEMGYKYGDISAGASALKDALGSAESGSGFYGELHSATVTWGQSFAKIMESAGLDVNAFKTSAGTALTGDGGVSDIANAFKNNLIIAMYGSNGSKEKPTGGVIKGINDAKDATTTLSATAQTNFTELTTAVQEWEKNTSPKLNTGKKKVDDLLNSLASLKTKYMDKNPNIVDIDIDIADAQTALQNFLDSLDKIEDQEVVITTTYRTNGSPNYGSGSSNSNNSYNTVNNTINTAPADTDPPFEIGDRVASKEQRQDGGINMVAVFKKDNLNSRADFWFGSQLEGKKVTNTATVNGQRIYQLQGLEGLFNQYWFKESQLVKYDTGGYTGAWGPEGRLAMLHQKEIILNAHDTENFLTAVEIVRSMSDRLEANARLAQQGFDYAITAAHYNTEKQQLEQNVHITAEFPNATDHNEIEQAFGNIINLATQYVNRK